MVRVFIRTIFNDYDKCAFLFVMNSSRSKEQQDLKKIISKISRHNKGIKICYT